jgi:hypothetical protein
VLTELFELLTELVAFDQGQAEAAVGGGVMADQ